MSKTVSRRSLIRGAAAGIAAPFHLVTLEAAGELLPFTDYTEEFQVEAQERNPRVKTFDLRRLDSWITPARQFFTFHQASAPTIDVKDWRLSIGGLVAKPMALTLEQLKRHPDRRTIPVTFECAGNSGHAALMNGLAGNAMWTGVGLDSLLQECGVKPEAREVVFLASDMEKERKWQAGGKEFTAPHGRSIFVQDALAAGPILAFEMNGAPLSAEHGYPLRLILPGWYGMANVKWLHAIEVIDRRYEGRHMARNYHSLRKAGAAGGGIWLDTSISRMNLKSVVARVLRKRSGTQVEHVIHGAAWSGESPIRTVEVRIDSGPWMEARVDRRESDAAWLLWSCMWKGAKPGPHTLVSRAIDTRGAVQPTEEELRERLASAREDNAQWLRTLIVPPY